MLAFSFAGISLILVFKTFILIGQGPSLTGIEPLYYYLSSFTHGLGELVACFIVFNFTIQQFQVLFGYSTNKSTVLDLKKFYSKFFKRTMPALIGVLFISSLCEVYISNRVIQLFLS